MPTQKNCDPSKAPNVGTTGWDILLQIPKWLTGIALAGFFFLMLYSIFVSGIPFQVAGMQFGASPLAKELEGKQHHIELASRSKTLPIAWVYFDYPNFTGFGISEIKSTGAIGEWLVTFDEPILGDYAVVSSGNQLNVTVRKKSSRSLIVETWNEAKTETTFEGVFNLVIFANGDTKQVE